MWDENKIRIVDIAEELRLSTATVSNVIHGKTKKISDNTIKRVQDKLQERGVHSQYGGDIARAKQFTHCRRSCE